VVVTANIPPFSRSGSRLDVTVSSIGNAKSLRGGVLVQTPLHGADRRTYAVAQGALVVGGFSASGAGSSHQDGVTTTARIPNGSLVEREIPTVYSVKGKLTLSLKSPDFSTAHRIVVALDKEFGKGTARALDGGAIEVSAPKALSGRPVELVAKLSEIEVDPVNPARVVINERTGTVVAGGDVRLSPVAIAQGGITISVRETREVSQPGPLAAGQTREVTNADLTTEEAKPAAALTYLGGAATLADVAQALSTFGVSPRELASILQALKAAGALRAEVIVPGFSAPRSRRPPAHRALQVLRAPKPLGRSCSRRRANSKPSSCGRCWRRSRRQLSSARARVPANRPMARWSWVRWRTR
jgi:flagellar P-ring protein precursor FlgI